MSDEYSLSDVLERIRQNPIGLKAALMELTFLAKKNDLTEAGDNIRSALWVIGENAGHIQQGLGRLKGENEG